MKFHLSFFWLIFLVLALYSHVLKTYFIIFSFLFIHEMGHILMARFFRYEVSDIYLYPFGFSARIHHLNHGTSFEIIVIMLSGLSMHLFFVFLIDLMQYFSLISITYEEYLHHMNLSILFFNLLPIYPLDGGRLLFAFFRLFLSYSWSKTIVFSLSFICLSYFMIIGGTSLRIILLFLFVSLIYEVKKSLMDTIDYAYYKEKHLKVV